jgi:hypothetical protein
VPERVIANNNNGMSTSFPDRCRAVQRRWEPMHNGSVAHSSGFAWAQNASAAPRAGRGIRPVRNRLKRLMNPLCPPVPKRSGRGCKPRPDWRIGGLPREPRFRCAPSRLRETVSRGCTSRPGIRHECQHSGRGACHVPRRGDALKSARRAAPRSDRRIAWRWRSPRRSAPRGGLRRVRYRSRRSP